jgi:hypothetical protein
VHVHHSTVWQLLMELLLMLQRRLLGWAFWAVYGCLLLLLQQLLPRLRLLLGCF